MDIRSQQFLGIMIAIAAIAILAFIAYFINARVRAARAASQQEKTEQPVFWHEFILATAMIVIIVAALLWQFTPDRFDWQAGNRPLIFLAVMLAAGLVALVGFIIALFTGLRPGAGERTPTLSRAAATNAPEAAPNAAEARPASAGIRLLGLLALIVAFLVLNWTAMDRGSQYTLVSTILYPAAITVALVLLMDKATRAWAAKTSVENYREWLFCDAFVFLLILAFINLQTQAEPENYQTLFWDVLQVTVFILVFWLIDRTTSSLRFLFGYLYLVALPVLLLIWRTLQEVQMPGAGSWWESIWPFFFLSILFFVLELIFVIASRETDRHGLSAAKDTLFVLLFGILLLIAIPATQVGA